jgi:hypothetical protein
VEPAAVSRTVPRVYRLTRLAGHDRMTGDALAKARRIAVNIAKLPELVREHNA